MTKQFKLALTIVSCLAAVGIVFVANTFFGNFTLRVFNLCAIYIVLAVAILLRQRSEVARLLRLSRRTIAGHHDELAAEAAD